MSEEALVFNGKKYISSRRASEISGYHIDYLGQLSRKGILESEMVGRNRYVSEESLFTYLHALNTKIASDHAPVFGDQKESEKYSKTSTERPVISNRQENLFSLNSQSASNALALESRLPNGLFERVVLVVAVAVLATVFAMPQARSGLMAVVGSLNQANVFPADQIFTAGEFDAAIYSGTPMSYRTLVDLDTQYFNTVHAIENFLQTIGIGAREFILRIMDSVWSIFANWRNPNDTIVEPSVFTPVPTNTKPASSGNSDLGTLSEEEIRKIFNEELDKRFTDGKSSREGMVVVPSSGTPGGDAAIKERIRKSFSDDVKVELDASKTAGVVRPQFKNPTDDSYIFLLVPVNQ